ncbi:hypothetical protein HU200_050292 [Digitaria exilis]|uniref:Uncharacterized protein n=1 Tax=Digitaria exilis TaxID=1010633 RepID=A0A835E7U1_9POAL|nr:hypothetical protein HU200_050292 [Digitaria exilis]
MLIQSLFFVTAVLLLSSATADEVTAEVIPLYYTCSDDGGRYRDNSTYLSNLKSLADTLVANAGTPNSFTPGAVGQAPDAVYGFVLCRGDCTGASCRDGLRKAFDDTVHKGFVCPLYKDVTIYYEQYMLQFSGDDIRRNFTNRPAWVASNMNNVTGETGKRYREKVQKLIDRIMDAAANSPGRYGTGKAWFGGEGGVTTAYGLLQCTPDLQADDCRSCLAELVSLMPGWFSGDEPNDYRVGGRILGPRCNLRYEKELFFQETNATLHIDVPKNHLGRMEILLLTIAAVLSIIILISLLAWIIQRRKDSKARNELEEWTRLITVEIGTMFSHFTLSEIRNATDNFSEAKKLGEGAFGPVYRGQLSCGIVAIKRLAAYSRQGLEQFRNEIRFIAKLQHLNLVKLVGCCMQQNEKILVYEYMHNGSLDDIFKDVTKWASITWPIRQNIIDGVAQGLLYIHNFLQPEICIIHRDLKPSNILLDHQMNPKISDFGIAMFSSSATESQGTVPMGTLGYMAPECLCGSSISVKFDVYSFGVLILEIISGRKVATSFRRYKRSDNLIAYAWQLWEDGNSKQLIDNSLSVEEHHQEAEILRCVQIALLCVQENPEDRPDMREVVRILSNKGTQLDNPNQPAYFHEPIASNPTSTQYLTAIHVHTA